MRIWDIALLGALLSMLSISVVAMVIEAMNRPRNRYRGNRRNARLLREPLAAPWDGAIVKQRLE